MSNERGVKGPESAPSVVAAPPQSATLPAGFGPSLPSGVLQRKLALRLQRKAGTSSSESSSAGPATDGSALPAHVQQKMEGSFGADFSSVRVHQGGAADAVGARAFAQGNDLHFAPGEYRPESRSGQELIGHELTHVVQQRGGAVQNSQVQGKDANVVEDHGLEREADDLGARAARGESVGGAVSGHASGVQLKKKGKPVAAPLTVQVDGTGNLFADDKTTKIGFKAGGKSWIAADGSGKLGVALADGKTGTLHAGGDLPILRMEEVDVTATADAAADGAKHGDKDADPAAAGKTSAATAVAKGKHAGFLASGDEVLEGSGKSFSPIEPGKLPASLQGKLNGESRIDLDSGEMWVWMSFSLKDETKDTPRWVPPGHSKKEYQSRQKAISAEAENIPDDASVKEGIDKYVRTISLVSAVEGDFSSKAGKGDDAASLGIFQWAMKRDSSAESGSLGVFFTKLKSRAKEAAAKSPDKQSAEEKLYVSAWAQCTAHGLDVSGKQILLHGEPATGGEVEGEMAKEMGKDSLRTYQLVAAKDWIDQFKQVIVRPGPVGEFIVGNGYSERADGAKITLKHGTESIEMTSDAYATVGGLFASEKSMATAVMLGVNRPHYVETALWRALNPKGNPKPDVDAKFEELLGHLHDAETAAAAAQPEDEKTEGKGKTKKKKKKKADKVYKSADVDAAGAEAKKSFADLKKLLWPTAELDEAGEKQLATEFKKQTMKLYKPKDAKKYHRERRFSTVESGW